MDELDEVRRVHPRFARYLGPPCVVRNGLIAPRCTEGSHFCGVPVWRDFPAPCGVSDGIRNPTNPHPILQSSIRPAHVPPHHHFRHRLHRPARVRHHHPADAVLRDPFRRVGVRGGDARDVVLLMQFLFAPLWGRWSDVMGRRPVILIGLLGSAVSYLTFGLAESLSLLFVSRCLAGVAGANISTAQAFIADSTTPENRAKGMGMVGAAFGLGFIFGPALGGFLSQWGYQTPALFAAGCRSSTSLRRWCSCPSPCRRNGGRRPAGVRRRGVRACPGTPALADRARRLLSDRVSVCQLRVDVRALQPGALRLHLGDDWLSVRGRRRRSGNRSGPPGRSGGQATGRAPAGAGCDRAADRRPGSGVRCQSMPALAMGCGIIAVGMGFQSPSMLSVISQLSDPEDQGSMLGVSQSLGSLARIVGPLWGGFVFDRFGHAAPFISAAVVMSIACALSLVAFQRL